MLSKIFSGERDVIKVFPDDGDDKQAKACYPQADEEFDRRLCVHWEIEAVLWN
jgi:hypothetical protein